MAQPTLTKGPYTGTSPIIDPKPSNVGSGNNIMSDAGITNIYSFTPDHIIRDVFNREDQKIGDWRLFLGMLGWRRGVAAPTTGHYERSQRINNVKIAAVITAAGGAGQQAIISLHADSMYNPGVTTGGTALWSSEVKKGDVIIFNSGVRAIVTAKDVTTVPATHRITVKPVLSTDTLVANITAGNNYSIFYNAWGEGTAHAGGTYPRVVTYSNNFQIIKESYGRTGSSLATDFYERFHDTEDGGKYGVIASQAMFLFERAINNALLFGSKSDGNVTVVSDHAGIDVPINTTEGMDRFAELYGHSDTYTTSAWAIDDLNTVGKIFSNERITGNRILAPQGYDYYVGVEDALITKNDNNLEPMLMKQIVVDSYQTNEYDESFGSSAFTFYTGFKAVNKGHYTYAFKHIMEFDDPTSGGNYGYSAYAYFLPIGTTKNATTGKHIANIGYEYRASDERGMSRENLTDVYGGAGAARMAGINASSGVDGITGVMLTEVAFHGACANRMIRQTNA